MPNINPSKAYIITGTKKNIENVRRIAIRGL